MMLAAVPEDQLQQIIAQTTVPDEHRRVFLGPVATAMLAIVGLGIAGCSGNGPEPVSAGIAPDEPPPE